MPLDNLPGKLVTLTRDQTRDKALQYYKLRNPSALTSEGTAPYLDASVIADVTQVHYANAITIANGITRATATGASLDDKAADLGTSRRGPQGGAGAVIISAGSSGTTILAGDICTQASTGLRFQCAATALYNDGAQVPIIGIDTGTLTNLNPGTVLQWQAPRPGCGPLCTVALQADGSGLSGGAPQESDDQLRLRLDTLAATPPASGNDADYQAAITKTPLIAVQAPFTYPGCMGPGSTGFTFTLRPAISGGNRIPSSTQLSQAAGFLGGLFPKSDQIYTVTMVANPVNIVLKVLWAQGASSWTDLSTWPPYIASPNLVSATADSSGTLSPTQFRLSSSGLTVAPQVGQSIGFYDAVNRVFRRKKILTVTTVSSTAYDLTIDTSNGASDTRYTPNTSQPCCPWSDGLNTLIPPITSYFDGIGPGEMFSTFFDPGLRQKRSPISPQQWPNVITNRLLGGSAAPVPASGFAQNLPPTPTLLTLSNLQDCVLVEPSVPYATPVGSPGVSVNLLTIGAICAFPE